VAACAAVLVGVASVAPFFGPASVQSAGLQFSARGVGLIVVASALGFYAFSGGSVTAPVRAGAGAGLLAGALLVLAVGRDLADRNVDSPGAIRLLQLFTYNYKRPWPAELDFARPLAGFAIVAAMLTIAMTRPASRRVVLVAWLALASATTVWALDRYFLAVAPHWGQRELFEAYYRERASASEPVVAYQMNWKGENIYTGNNVPAFVSSGAPFTTWLRKKQEEGVRRFFFVTEHTRLGGLRSEAQGKTFREVTTKTLNNKFVLVEVTF
jgi:hypothetical protein